MGSVIDIKLEYSFFLVIIGMIIIIEVIGDGNHRREGKSSVP